MTRLEHKDCGGGIVENVLSRQATIQLKCLKCEKFGVCFPIFLTQK